MIILRQKAFAKGFREYDKIKKLQERYDYESQKYGEDSVEAQKTMNRIIRENSVLDARSVKYGQEHTKTARQMGGYNKMMVYKYEDVAPHIVFSPNANGITDRLNILSEREKDKYKRIELSENGKDSLMSESLRKLNGSNIAIIRNAQDIDKFIDSLSEEDAEKIVGIYSRGKSAKEALKEQMLDDISKGVDGAQVSIDLKNKKSYTILPEDIPAQSVAHEVIGHGDGENYGDTAENPVRASMQKLPNYHLRTENAANQKVLDFSKDKLSKDDNQKLKDAYDAQEKSNMYDVHSTEIFRYNNNKPVSGPLYGTTMIKKSKRKNGF